MNIKAHYDKTERFVQKTEEISGFQLNDLNRMTNKESKTNS